MSIGSNLKKIRSTVGISQSELARIADITSVYVSNIENDKKSPSAEILAKIASALGVSIDDFFKDKLGANDDEENNDRIFGLNRDSEDVLNNYGGLNSEDKEKAKAFLKFLHSQNKK